ncbi:MAG TPA: ABC transporter transmembrane domain-containing protein [Chloroflexia bacterium]|nr:ABC transporter transmembrane domain-containing protein [Chloroflexia bacterium]
MSRPETIQETLPGFWRIVRRFAPYLRQERRLITFSLVALLAEVGLRLLEPWPLKLVFDSVFPTNTAPRSTGLAWLDSLDPSALLIVCAVGVVVVTALRAVASYVNTVGFAMTGNRVLSHVRAQLYNHMQRLSLSFHTRARSGDLVVRVISDVSQLKDVAVTALLPLVAHLLILVGMVALMLWLNWQLTLLALATVPLFWLSTVRIGKRIQEAARKQRRREGAMAATASEAIGAIKVVQALSLEDTLSGSFFSQNSESLKQDAKASKLSASLERTVDVLIAISTGLVLWYGATLVMRNSMTPGDLLVFLTYLKNTFKPVRDFAKYTGRLAKATAAGERVLDILEREPDVRDMPGAVPAPAFKGAVSFQDVIFEYEPGHPVLRDVNLNIEPGQHVALVGSSGNGKSTLVSMVLRLYDPTSGHVSIDGRDIREYTLASLRSQISVVMQDTVLFAATARENIAYGVPEASDEEIEAAARLANAHDFIMALPDGYDTVLGERGATLSNGQRQRISIARAAIRKAPILILDEPTTSLDEENEREVMLALWRLMQGRTTFLITHKLSQARSADTILVLEKGLVIEQGTHEELLRRGGIYANLCAAPLTLEERQGRKASATAATRIASAIVPTSTSVVQGERAATNGRLDQENMVSRKEMVAQRKPPDRSKKWKLLAALGVGLVLIAVPLFTFAVQASNPPSHSSAPDEGPVTTASTSQSYTAPLVSADTPAGTETSQARMAHNAVEGRDVVTFSGNLTGSLTLAWSPDSRTLALGSIDHSIRLLDVSTGNVVTLRGHTNSVYSVAWSPDGKTLASGSWDKSVRLWSADGKLRSILGGHSGFIAGLGWMPDGQTLGAVSANVNVTLWDAHGNPKGSFKGGGDLLYNLAWSPDGKSFATGTNDGAVRLWKADGTLTSTLYGHTGAVFSVAWSPDGSLLASGSDDNTVRLWSADGVPLATLAEHTDFVNWVAWSPDGKTLASAGDTTVRLWTSTGEPISVLSHSGMALVVSWSPDGKTLSSIAVDATSKEDTVWLWQMGSKQR